MQLIMQEIHLQEPNMPQGDKAADTDKRGLRASRKGDEPTVVSRPRKQGGAWAPVNKRAGAGKKIDARRKLPSGPVGGSGRKTNLSRSS
jgi:hypothetical protein